MMILQPNTSAFFHSIYFGFYLIHFKRQSKKLPDFFITPFSFHQHLVKVNEAINNLICALWGRSKNDQPCLKNSVGAALPILKKYFFPDCIFSRFFKASCSNQYLNHPVAIVPT